MSKEGVLVGLKKVPEHKAPLPMGPIDVGTLNKDNGPILFALSWLNGDLEGKELHVSYVMGRKEILVNMTTQIEGHPRVEGATVLQAEVIKNDYLEEADQVLARVQLENVKHRVVTPAMGIGLVAATIVSFKYEIFDSLPLFGTLADKAVHYVTGGTVPMEKVLSGWFEVAKANNILLRAISEVNPVEFSVIVIGLLGITYALFMNKFQKYIDSKQNESLIKMSKAITKLGSMRDKVLGMRRRSFRARTLEEYFDQVTEE